MIREKLIEDIKEKLLKYKKIILYGESGVGKTYLAKHIARTTTWYNIIVQDEIHRKISTVSTFNIGTTTTEMWLQESMFRNRGFYGYFIPEATKQETIDILFKLKPYYESLRHIKITDYDIELIYAIADKFMTHRAFPAKGVDLMDMTTAKQALKNGLNG